jgi:hypothetical protein
MNWDDIDANLENWSGKTGNYTAKSREAMKIEPRLREMQVSRSSGMSCRCLHIYKRDFKAPIR